MYHNLKHTKPVLKTFKNVGLLFVYEGWFTTTNMTFFKGQNP